MNHILRKSNESQASIGLGKYCSSLRDRSLSFMSFLCLAILLSTPKIARSQNQELNWQILGDLSLEYPHTTVIPNSFTIGDIDLWFQRSFGEQWSAMGELMLMGMAGDSMYMIHPARLFLEHSHSDSLQIRIGQIHTPIGIYSQRYPHGGKVFEPTIHRPLLARVEDGADILPYHTLGVSARGTQMLSESLEMMYIVGIGNGYNHGNYDTNFQKSPFFQIRLSPLDIFGLSFGLSGYHDLITKDEIKGSIEQSIFAFSLLYDSFPWDILVESYVARHSPTPGDSFKFFSPRDNDEITTVDGKQPNKQLYGGYLQASYMWDEQAVYGMLEAFNRDKGDYLFNEHTAYIEYRGMEMGHRWHINQHLVFKSAYSYVWSDALHRLDFQLAYRL